MVIKLSIRILLIILAVLAVIVVGGLVFLRIIFPPALSQKATEKDFVKNQDNILIVTTYLINAKYDNVYIPNIEDDGVVFANLDGHITVDDPTVINAIKVLLKRKGSVIGKDGNTIHFQRSTVFRDFGSGVVYSIDGNEPTLQYLTKLEPLSEPNWYYYEEDVIEFRKREQSQ